MFCSKFYWSKYYTFNYLFLSKFKKWARPFDLERAMKKSSSETIAYRARLRLRLEPREARKHLANLYSWSSFYYNTGKIGSGSLHEKCNKEIEEFKSFYNL